MLASAPVCLGKYLAVLILKVLRPKQQIETPLAITTNAVNLDPLAILCLVPTVAVRHCS